MIVTALLAIGCSSSGDSNSTVPIADLVVINADVYTSDNTQPRAEAFAVHDGKFLAIGTDEDVMALVDDRTEVIDASGRTLVPGLVDGHAHLGLGSWLATGVDLSEIEDKGEWLRLIAEKTATVSDGDWILGGGWDHNLSDGVLPTKEMLDSVAPNNPVLLRDIDFHSSWANSLAIELAGVTADSPVPPGGEVVVDSESGELTGIFKEGAGFLFNDAPGMSEATDPVAGLRGSVALANSLGITTMHDMSPELDPILSILESGELTARIWHARQRREQTPRGEFLALADERERIRQRVAATGFTQTKGPLVDFGYVKFYVDGVLSTYTALMKEPYSDNRGADPEPRVEKMELTEMVAAAHEHGFPVAVHAIGDEAVSWALDAFATSPSKPGMLRDRIEHMEVVSPDDVERFKSLGIVASMQPHHATCCVGNYVIDRIGHGRLPNAYAWRSVLDRGIPLVFGADWPTAPLSPLVQISDAINRETRIDGVMRPWDEGKALTFDEALYSYTQAGANMTPWADQIGSIRKGKWADFVILDGQIPVPAGDSIESMRAVATYLAGTKVYP